MLYIGFISETAAVISASYYWMRKSAIPGTAMVGGFFL
jgi:hypothetical protein